MSASRRGFFGFLFGGVAAAALPKPPLSGDFVSFNWGDYAGEYAPTSEIAGLSTGLAAELTEITRKAFLPRVRVQLYEESLIRDAFLGDADD